MLRLAGEHDPGFDVAMFADALRAVRRLPLAEFTAYGLNEAEVAALSGRMIQWAASIDLR